MKKQLRLGRGWYVLPLIIISAIACKKETSANLQVSDDAATTIAVPATAARGSAGTDSVYLVQACERRQRKDSISESAVPASVATYLAANYSGYSFYKAFAIKDAGGNVVKYVVVIFFNNKPVGIAFGATGNFLRVLEQRERRDLNGSGWHPGGRFEGRGDCQKDSVALSALPAAISAYLQSNYSGDTLIKAFKSNNDSIYLVITRNSSGVFANFFKADGMFIKRVQVHQRNGHLVPVEQAALPAAVSAYLNTTYPGYVFKKAFAITQNGAVAGIVVIVEANTTRYALEFDATGAFIKVKVLH